MDVVVSRDGNRIFTTNYYYDSISQLDLANGNTRTDLSTHDSWPADIAITPDEAKVLVSVGRDGRRYDMDNDSIAIYNIRNGEFSYIASVVLDDEISGKNIGMSLDSLFAYVPTRPRKSPMPRLYELSLVSPYQVTRVMELQGTEATALAGVVCIGDRVFVADRNGDRVWVVDRTSWTRNAYSLGFSPTVLAQHPSGRYIFAAAQADGVPIVVAIDVSSMSVAARYDGLPSEINDIEFSSDGTKMYMCRRHQQGAIVVFSLSW